MERSGTTPAYKALEQAFAGFVGTEYGISVCNGTAALHLALLALGVQPGDEVIVPDFTMASCAFAVSYIGAKPVFVDCNDNYLIDLDLIEEKITAKTKVIMPVHIYGRVVNMDRVMEIASKHNLRVLEDCSEAHGATWNGKRVGSFDVGVFSLYANKIVHAQEGGIITTSDETVRDRANYLKCLAFTPEHDFMHPEIGFNYRMPDAMAQLALKSLADIEKNLAKRRRVETWYDRFLPTDKPRDVVWVYDFLIQGKDEIVSRLFDKGARHFFKPMTSLPMYAEDRRSKAKYFSERGMYLPVKPGMQKKEIAVLIDLLLNP